MKIPRKSDMTPLSGRYGSNLLQNKILWIIMELKSNKILLYGPFGGPRVLDMLGIQRILLLRVPEVVGVPGIVRVLGVQGVRGVLTGVTKDRDKVPLLSHARIAARVMFGFKNVYVMFLMKL